MAGSPGGRQHAAPRRMSGGLRWYLQSREDGDRPTVTVPTAVGREDGAGWGALWPLSTPARPRATLHAGDCRVCVSRAPNPDPAARQPHPRSARVPNAARSKLVSPPSPPHASRSHRPVPRGDVPSSSPGQRLQGLADPARLSHSTVTPPGSCAQRPRGAPRTPPSHAPGAALSAQRPGDQPPRPRRCSVPPALPGSPELLGRWARPESKHAPSVRRTPRRVHPGNHCSTVASRKNDQITPGSQRSHPEC